MYAKAGDLVKLLTSWRPASVKKLPDLIVELAQLMADTNFWEQVRLAPLFAKRKIWSIEDCRASLSAAPFLHQSDSQATSAGSQLFSKQM